MNVNGLIHERGEHVGLLSVFVAIVAIRSYIGSQVAGTVVVFAIFAIGYNLLFGYGGEMSFGHAAFFGVGSYGIALGVMEFGLNPFLSFGLAIAAATIIGLVIGVISLVRRGIYFAMISLALAQMAYFLVINSGDVTGGSNGLFLPLTAGEFGPLTAITGSIDFFILSMITLALIWLFVSRLLKSPYGLLLRAVRTNEQRAQYLGVNPYRILVGAFVISAVISGVAGVFYALHQLIITPNILYWTLSGQIVIITILGGAGSMNGPLLGALLFIVGQDFLVDITGHWPIFYGLVFVVIVLTLPGGLISINDEFSKRRKSIDFEDYRP